MNKFTSNELSRYYDMIEDIRTERSKVSGRIENSSFFRIPAVKNFDIIVKEQNELLKGTGFDRKLQAEFDYEVFGDNNVWNKYLKREIKFLRSVRHKPHVFWAHVEVLMKHSMAFRVSAFNKVHHGWYKELPVERIFQITFGMNKIIEKSLTDLKYFRVHIPKDGPKAMLQWYLDNPGKTYTKTRPLGVPTAPWRVILHMWNGFLVLFLEDELKQFNHAYTPNVGTMTCLREWVKEVLPKKYIYEFDFKGFFNNVSITNVMDLLKERGMPGKTATKLNSILWSAPANLDLDNPDNKPTSDYDTTLAARNYVNVGKPHVVEYVVPEKPVYDMQKARYAKDEELDIDKRLDLWNLKYSIVEGKGKYVWLRGRVVFVPLLEKQTFVNDGRYQSSSETVMTRHGLMKRIKLVEKMHKGLPQGAAPSTTLSLLALAPWAEQLKSKNIGLLMYADDGFLFSDEPFEPFEPVGLEFAPDKSFWLKKDGIPQKDKVKFLGVEYSFTSNMIAAKTREGSRLQFGDAQYYVIDHYLEEVRRPGPQSRSWYNVHFDPKNLEHFAKDLDTQDGSKGQEESGPVEKAAAVYEVAEELREGGGDRLEKLVNSGIWGLALSKLYGGQWGKQFFPVKTAYEENSWWGKFYNIRMLQKDLKLQRLASTIACEWLIEHMTQMTTSIKKARKYATHALRFFKPYEDEVQDVFVRLRREVEMENYWDSKKLSLVPYDPESQHSLKPRSPGPVRLTKRERKTLRRSLMSEDQRIQWRPNAPILSEAEFKKRQLNKRSKSVKPKNKRSTKKAPRTLW